jgi:hypothetical protein
LLWESTQGPCEAIVTLALGARHHQANPATPPAEGVIIYAAKSRGFVTAARNVA